MSAALVEAHLPSGVQLVHRVQPGEALLLSYDDSNPNMRRPEFMDALRRAIAPLRSALEPAPVFLVVPRSLEAHPLTDYDIAMLARFVDEYRRSHSDYAPRPAPGAPSGAPSTR